jgi:NAD(P)H-dependent FMN reductase
VSAMLPRPPVYVVVGSTRPRRIGRQVADWVLDNIPADSGFGAELVDLKDWHLPLSDEPHNPSTGLYVQDHTLTWSRKIAAAAGFIFVTPQYNWGYPASLKNALDHLRKEWNGKPATIVSYGHHGGVKAAAQLRQVLEGLRMLPTQTMVAITFSEDMLAADRRLRDPAEDFSAYARAIAQACAELSVLVAARTKEARFDPL